MYIRVYLLRVYWNHSYGMSTLDLLPMLYIVGLRGRYISTDLRWNSMDVDSEQQHIVEMYTSKSNILNIW